MLIIFPLIGYILKYRQNLCELTNILSINVNIIIYVRIQILIFLPSNAKLDIYCGCYIYSIFNYSKKNTLKKQCIILNVQSKSR